jgi:glutaredoxin-related protein
VLVNCLMSARLKEVINQERVMLFMKGSVESPQCGFSRSMCEILKEHRLSVPKDFYHVTLS